LLNLVETMFLASTKYSASSQVSTEMVTQSGKRSEYLWWLCSPLRKKWQVMHNIWPLWPGLWACWPNWLKILAIEMTWAYSSLVEFNPCHTKSAEKLDELSLGLCRNLFVG